MDDLGTQEVEYLDFFLCPSEVAINPHKTKPIKDWPNPERKKDVQYFLGLVNYYRKFIRNYSDTAKPLTLLTKSFPLTWTEEHQEVFDSLQTRGSTTRVLQKFHPEIPNL